MNTLIRQLSKIFDLTIEEMYAYFPTFKEHYHEYLILKNIRTSTTLLLIISIIITLIGAFCYRYIKSEIDETLEVSYMKVFGVSTLIVSLVAIRIIIMIIMANNPSPVDISHILDILIF